jgi:hypothetical protein
MIPRREKTGLRRQGPPAPILIAGIVYGDQTSIPDFFAAATNC